MNSNVTYLSYLQAVRSTAEAHVPDHRDLLTWLQSMPPHSTLQPSAFYLLDYVQYKYRLFLSSGKDILGYTPSYLTDAGPEFLMSRIYSSDMNIINQQIFPANLRYLKSMPGNPGNFTFTCTYRILAKDGSCRSLSQKATYISAVPGKPLATMGIISDISAFKSDPRIMHVIENADASHSAQPEIMFYYPDEPPNLSHREVDVLKWVGDGLSSKQIAAKLKVSIHTIHNHRKHMLEKAIAKTFQN